MYLKTKLSLTSFEIFQLSITTIKLKNTGDVFTITLPDVNLHNYIIGAPYLWFKGNMTCTNKLNGDKAQIRFKSKGWTSKSDYECDGSIMDSSGRQFYQLTGLWSESLEATDPNTGVKTILATKNPEPLNQDKQFFLTRFAINLNNLTPEMLEKIAPTDSRLRPDLRAFEFKNIDLASSEKTRLEEKQRKRRKEMEEKGEKHKAAWFNFNLEGDIMNVKFRGDYFAKRENKEWPDSILDLF
jgi:hypothetical protein